MRDRDRKLIFETYLNLKEAEYPTYPPPRRPFHGGSKQGKLFTPYDTEPEKKEEEEEEETIYGCMDPRANNYNPEATKQLPNSCLYGGGGGRGGAVERDTGGRLSGGLDCQSPSTKLEFRGTPAVREAFQELLQYEQRALEELVQAELDARPRPVGGIGGRRRIAIPTALVRALITYTWNNHEEILPRIESDLDGAQTAIFISPPGVGRVVVWAGTITDEQCGYLNLILQDDHDFFLSAGNAMGALTWWINAFHKDQFRQYLLRQAGM